MEFHPDKCKHLLVNRARTQTDFEYSIYCTTLELVTETKYLGWLSRKDLSWGKHCRQVRNAACASLRLPQRNLRVKSVAMKTLAYQTYVRPRAEYASCVWSPHTVSDSHQVEMVQCTAARWVLSWRNIVDGNPSGLTVRRPLSVR